MLLLTDATGEQIKGHVCPGKGPVRRVAQYIAFTVQVIAEGQFVEDGLRDHQKGDRARVHSEAWQRQQRSSLKVPLQA